MVKAGDQRVVARIGIEVRLQDRPVTGIRPGRTVAEQIRRDLTLVVVVPVLLPMTAVAEIAQLEHAAAAQRALEREVPLLDIGRAPLFLEREGGDARGEVAGEVLVDRRQRDHGKDVHARNELGDELARVDGVNAVRERRSDGRELQLDELHVREVNSRSRPQHRLVVQLPCDADSRRDVVAVGLDHARVHLPEHREFQEPRGGIEPVRVIRRASAGIRDRVLEPRDAPIQRQVAAHLPRVLHVRHELRVPILEHRQATRAAAIRRAQQVVGESVSATAGGNQVAGGVSG